MNNAKSFLYALRALLCAKWIVEEMTIPSVDALPLIKRYMDKPELSKAIGLLIENKASQKEKDKDPLPQILLDFGNNLYDLLRASEPKAQRLMDLERYDEVMGKIIRKSGESPGHPYTLIGK